jgi:DNA-directed RNA polymerase sigma subunit (sigma70/sigma32)
MSDYLLQIKIKNAPFLKIMRMQGYDNCSQLSRALGIHPTQIGEYINLKRPAISPKTGKWNPTIKRIADFLKVTPDLLFPEQHLKKALTKNLIESEVSLTDLRQLPGFQKTPYLEAWDEEEEDPMHRFLEESLEAIPARGRRVLEKRFGLDGGEPITLHETGKDFAVTTERVRQIEMKALRTLKRNIEKKYG